MKNLSIGVVSSSSRLSGVSATSGLSPSTTSLSFLPGNFRYCGPFGAAGAAACAWACGMDGNPPPTAAPNAASAVPPKNPRRLVSSPTPASCAMVSSLARIQRITSAFGCEYFRFPDPRQGRRGTQGVGREAVAMWPEHAVVNELCFARDYRRGYLLEQVVPEQGARLGR